MQRIQGYKYLRGIAEIQCATCDAVIQDSARARHLHEQSAGHRGRVEQTHPTSAVFASDRLFWVPWQLAPDSDPQQRFILTTADGEHEHPAGFKFSSGVEACNFLANNPEVDAVRESDPRVLCGAVWCENPSDEYAETQCCILRQGHSEDHRTRTGRFFENPEAERLSDLVDGTPDEINATVARMNYIEDHSVDLEAPCAGCGNTPQTCTCTDPEPARDCVKLNGTERDCLERGDREPCEACSEWQRWEARNHNLNAALDALDTLREYLIEAHTPEMDDGHGGDSDHEGPDPDGCSYCAAIQEAEEVATAAKAAYQRTQQQPPAHTGELVNGLIATVERAEKGGKQ